MNIVNSAGSLERDTELEMSLSGLTLSFNTTLWIVASKRQVVNSHSVEAQKSSVSHASAYSQSQCHLVIRGQRL